MIILWNNAWGYRQQDYQSWPSKIGKDQQKISIRMTQSGSQIRIRFSNLFGQETIRFKNILVKNKNEKTGQIVSVNKLININLLPGSTLISDPVVVHFKKGDTLEISTILENEPTLTGGIVTYSDLITSVENFRLDKPILQKDLFRMVFENNKMQYIYGISGIDICSETPKIVFFGDSLTQQGYIVDHFKMKLINENNVEFGVTNYGIGGSRVLSNTDKEFDSYERHGVSGLQRFESDCFSQGLVRSIVILHGINDIITSNSKRIEEELINGLKQYAEIAHIHGAKIFIATLMPFGNSQFFSQEFEKARKKVNDWIRNNTHFDGYFDFSKAVENPNNPIFLKKEADSGDGLHLSDEGGRLVAESIELIKL